MPQNYCRRGKKVSVYPYIRAVSKVERGLYTTSSNTTRRVYVCIDLEELYRFFIELFYMELYLCYTYTI